MIIISNFNPYTDARNAISIMKENMKDKNMNGYSIFSSFYACDPFSREDINSYYRNLKINEGKVLTVCGSGDFALSAILYGAKKIDCFDINKLSYYNLMLKKYAIMYLDYKDFYFFYNLSNRVIDRKKIYSKFKEKIDDNTVKYFWDYIFSNAEQELQIDQFFPYFFKERDYDMEELIKRIPYLSKKGFMKLKELLGTSEISFINSDFYHIFDTYGDQYDFINFCNMYELAGKDKSSYFISNIRKAKNFLNKKGKMLIKQNNNSSSMVGIINNENTEEIKKGQSSSTYSKKRL